MSNMLCRFGLGAARDVKQIEIEWPSEKNNRSVPQKRTKF
jgi:hypothetical protein